MCLMDFHAVSSTVILSFEYNMFGSCLEAGTGMCAYLLDPSVPGWDNKFDGLFPPQLSGVVLNSRITRNRTNGVLEQNWCSGRCWIRQHRY